MSSVVRPSSLLRKLLKTVGLLCFVIVLIVLFALYAVTQRSDWTASVLQHWQTDITKLRYAPFSFSRENTSWVFSSAQFSMDWQSQQVRSEQLTIRLPAWALWPETINIGHLSIVNEAPLAASGEAETQGEATAPFNPYQELQKLGEIQAFELTIEHLKLQQGQNHFQGRAQWQHQERDRIRLSGRADLPEFSDTAIAFSTELNVASQNDRLSFELESQLREALTMRLNGSSTGANQAWDVQWQAEWSNKALLAIVQEIQAMPLDIKLDGDNLHAEGQLSIGSNMNLISATANLNAFADQGVDINYDGLRFPLILNMPERTRLEWRDQQAQIEMGTLTLDLDAPDWGQHHVQLEGKTACHSGPCAFEFSIDSQALNVRALEKIITLPELEAVLRSWQWRGELNLDVSEKTASLVGQSNAHVEAIRFGNNRLSALGLSIDEMTASLVLSDSSPRIQLNVPTLDIVVDQVAADENADIKTLTVNLERILVEKSERMTADLEWRLNAHMIQASGFQLAGILGQGKVALKAGRVAFSGDVLTDLAEPLLTFTGRHDGGAVKPGGDLLWQWQFAPFSPVSSLEKRFGRWPLEVNALSGELTGGGELSWQLGDALSWEARGKQALTHIGGVYDDIGFVELSISHDWSIASTAGLQVKGQMDLGSLDIGLAVEDVAMNFTLNSDSGVVIEGFKADLLDGRVESPRLELNQREGLWESEVSLLNIKAIRLESLLRAADYAGLDATANLSGELPVAIRANKLHIEQGKLAATEPGYIRYEGLSDSGNPLMEMVSEALSNYQYEHLTADVEYDDSGYLQMAVALKGHNPDFQNGRQVNLNLNISDNVPNLMKSLQAGRIITDVISEKLDQ
ncbi:intermembrane phospholipid transport protein YdbH family protein [Pseudoteredinibacter isoporae]|uniref:intermembrane phospholipid transport protein YdbH family protein n=1 Tax=Pseudoteredinibacter isoporae TaxID=570281 RepID=UPI003108CA32